MKKRIFFILCAFVINACVVLWLVREPMMELLAQHNNPALQSMSEALPSLHLPDISLPQLPDISSPLEIPSLKATSSRNKAAGVSFENHSARYTLKAGRVCDAAAFGQTSQDKTQAKTMYRWRDESGTIHLSDTFPEGGNIAVTTLRRFPAARFHLKLHGDVPNAASTDTLRKRLFTILDEYAGIMDSNTLRDVTLNLTFFSSPEAFNIEKNLWTHTNSRGVYASDENRAIILQQDKNAFPSTALHESVHAINDHFFGITPRWLNEGLAGYFSSQTPPKSNATPYKPTQDIVNRLVFATNEDWNEHNRQWLYANSQAFVRYLLQSESGRLMIAKLLMLEIAAPCSAIEPEHIARLIQEHKLK